jgi:hypothetical protein
MPPPVMTGIVGIASAAHLHSAITGSVDDVRDQLLAAVRGRIETGDPQEILAPDAQAEADQLLGFLAVSDGIDAEVAYALGLLHLLRGESRGDAGQQDLLVALFLLLPIYLTQPDALPDPVRSWIGGLDGVADLAAVPLEQALAVALVEVGNLLLQRLVRLGEFGNGAAVVGVVRRTSGGPPGARLGAVQSGLRTAGGRSAQRRG